MLERSKGDTTMERESLCSEEQQILQATEDARISGEVFPFGRSAVESNRGPSRLPFSRRESSRFHFWRAETYLTVSGEGARREASILAGVFVREGRDDANVKKKEK